MLTYTSLIMFLDILLLIQLFKIAYELSSLSLNEFMSTSNESGRFSYLLEIPKSGLFSENDIKTQKSPIISKFTKTAKLDLPILLQKPLISLNTRLV